MHIHPNSTLLLAALGAGGEETREVQAKRAAEVRRKLSSTPHVLSSSEEPSGHTLRAEERAYRRQAHQGEETSFGTLFSAKV